MTTVQLAPLLMLVSGFCHAIVNAILKAGKDKMSSRALIDGFSALLMAPVIFFVPLPAHAWGWLFASWLVHLVYLVSLVKAFETLDMTVAYPIARGLAPVLAAAGAVVFFREPITPVIVVGILFVSLGVLAIGFHPHLSRRALGWSGLTGLTIALYTVIDAQGVRAAPTAISYIAWTFLMLGAGIGCLGANTRNPNNDADTEHESLLLDVAACVLWLKRERGAEHVILLGNSGGGSLAAFYQAEARLPPAQRLGRTPHER